MHVRVKVSATPAGKQRLDAVVTADSDKETTALQRYQNPHRRTGRFVSLEVYEKLVKGRDRTPPPLEDHMMDGYILWDAPLLLLNSSKAKHWRYSAFICMTDAMEKLVSRLSAARCIEAVTIALEQIQLEIEYQQICGD